MKSNHLDEYVSSGTSPTPKVPTEYEGREGYYLSLLRQAEAMLKSWEKDKKKNQKKNRAGVR